MSPEGCPLQLSRHGERGATPNSYVAHFTGRHQVLGTSLAIGFQGESRRSACSENPSNFVMPFL
jgi:hypothetical protein